MRQITETDRMTKIEKEVKKREKERRTDRRQSEGDRQRDTLKQIE